MARRNYLDTLEELRLLRHLAPFDPHVVGTPPLGIDLPGSDIDILCEVSDADAFCHTVWRAFADCPDFSLRQWTSAERAMIAQFTAGNWPIEIFAQAQPVPQQAGWKHYEVERRLLNLGGPAFRDAVMALRQTGVKTEPAFARALALPDNPYTTMLALADAADAALVELLAKAGYPA